MFPFLREKIVLVKGYQAYGIYDLNQGLFHRINLEAGELLRSLNGTRSLREFDEDERNFISQTIDMRLVEFAEFAGERNQTDLSKVLRKVRPVRFAWVEITSKCNQLCAHCFLGDDLNHYPHVSKDLIFEHFETLSRSGARQLIISGGEPTVHPDFLEILDRAATYPFRISLLSNASRSGYVKFVSSLLKYEVTVKIPILGWQTSHDKMTGVKGSFERTIHNIQMLIDAGVKVELGTTVTGINFEDISKIREFANSLRVPLEVSPVYAIGYAKKNASEVLGIKQDQIIKVCQEDKATSRPVVRTYPPSSRRQHEMELTDYDAVNLKDYLTEHHECGQKIIAILSNGEVTPCLMLREKKYSLGSTSKYSLQEILERKSDRAREFDEMMSLRDIPGCSGCEARFVCKAGGCPASAVAYAGSLQLKNPMFARCYYAGEATRSERPLAGAI
jgi:radical SAM protein with 4Fe4S-binding SPASM domain